MKRALENKPARFLGEHFPVDRATFEYGRLRSTGTLFEQHRL